MAQVIALRRTPMPEAEAADRRLRRGRTTPQALVALFVATFDHINTARDRVMAGITRYAHKQAALEAEIEELRHEFAALEAAEPKDFDRMDARRAGPRLVDADLPGPPAVADLCLRDAGDPRAARLRDRPGGRGAAAGLRNERRDRTAILAARRRIRMTGKKAMGMAASRT